MQPFNRVHPGGQLSSEELNRAFAEIERQNRLIVSAPLLLTPDFQGNKLSIFMRPGMFVRITGQGSGGSGGSGSTTPSYCYSGIEQTSSKDGDIYDLDTGVSFDSVDNPLVEMSENENVPEDAIVWAQMAASGDHYEFLWEEGGGGSGCSDGESGCGSGGSDSRCCVRISDFFRRIGDDCSYRDGCLCITADGGLEFIPDA
jgi:hypothetical protein